MEADFSMNDETVTLTHDPFDANHDNVSSSLSCNPTIIVAHGIRSFHFSCGINECYLNPHLCLFFVTCVNYQVNVDVEAERCGICMDTVVDRGVLDCCQHWYSFSSFLLQGFRYHVSNEYEFNY